MRKLTVIAYDIANNKRRKKAADLLELYGYRANKSVFECFVSQNQTNDILHKLNELINPKTDTVLIYPLCKNCIETKQTIGFQTIQNETITKI